MMILRALLSGAMFFLLPGLAHAQSASISPGPTNFGVDSLNGATTVKSSDGETQFEIVPLLGAKNAVNVQGSFNNGGPVIFSEGADANIDFNMSAKGTGIVTFGSGLGVSAQAMGPSNAIAVAWPVLQSAGNAVTPVVAFTAASVNSSYPNVIASLVSLGTAGTSAGIGNTPTGQRSFTGGGYNSHTGYGGIALGNANAGTAIGSVLLGSYSTDDAVPKIAYTSAIIGATKGTTKSSIFSMQCESVGAGTCQLTTDISGVAVGYNNYQLAAKKTLACRIIVTARDTTSGATATWFAQAAWSVNATAATAIALGSASFGAPTYSNGTGASSWTATLGLTTGSTPAFAYVIGTGLAGANTIRWHSRSDCSEDQNG
jgi:hypothetical protein